jgi:succinate-acetate transporter protein
MTLNVTNGSGATDVTQGSGEIDVTHVKNLDVTANPAALGLTAFGVTTVLLNLRNAGYFELGSMILAMGMFYGGLGQIIAGIMEWKKSNTFGMTAFISFGLFWETLVALLILPKLGLADATSANGMAAYFVMWGIFTFIMFVGSLKANRALQVVLGLLTVLFFLLAIGEITGNANVVTIAGYEGILTGFAAIYAGLGQVLNEMYKRTVAPLG